MSNARKLLQRVINSVPFHSSHERLKSEIEAELAKPEDSGMTVVDIQDDDALRFVQRVLESDAPEADRQTARDMIVGIRTRARGLVKPEADSFQSRVFPWLLSCFGEEIANDKVERNHRFLEESLELVQSCGCTQSEAHQLVDYVFGRPTGEIEQETGGVMVTLAALCLAQKINMHEAGEIELSRIWTKVEQIRAKQAAKPKHSPLPAKPEAEPFGFVRLYEFEHLKKQPRGEDKPVHTGNIWGKKLEDDNIPVYSSPRPMQRLTDEEIKQFPINAAELPRGTLGAYLSGWRDAESYHFPENPPTP